MAAGPAKTAWLVLIIVSIIIIVAGGLNIWFTKSLSDRLALINGVDRTVANFQNALNVILVIFGIIMLIVALYNYFAKAGTLEKIYKQYAPRWGEATSVTIKAD